MSGALGDNQSQQYQKDSHKCEDTQKNENEDNGEFAVSYYQRIENDNWTNSIQLQNREDWKCKIAIKINNFALFWSD